MDAPSPDADALDEHYGGKVDNRRPKPAYLCFAADFIAEEDYTISGLSERGLLWSLLNFCWVNGSIAADHCRMAKLLSVPPQDIEAAYGPLVRKHLHPMPHDPLRLFCPELERQRRENAEYRKKLAEGGRKGGLKTQERHRSQASSQAKAPEMNREEMKRKAVSREGCSSEHAEWLHEYEGAASYEIPQ
jgi:hypothetical protein